MLDHPIIPYDIHVDACGLQCPLPILRAKKGLASLNPGQVLCISTTDPHAARDFRAFCQQTGHIILQQIESEPLHPAPGTGTITQHWIQKAASRPAPPSPLSPLTSH